MPGLDPGIHAFPFGCQDVDGRDKPGHDDGEVSMPNGPQRHMRSPCRQAGEVKLAGIALAIGLAPHHALGEMDQHPLAAMVLQFAKRPQQAQVKQ